VIVQSVGTSELLGLALRGLLGRLGEDDRVRNFAFQTMTVHLLSRVSKRGIKVAVDGEIFWCPPPITFRVAPHPLMLMAPAPVAQ
jgi:diacylglycerol kinase family enzyme